jgi:lipoprotein NlpD
MAPVESLTPQGKQVVDEQQALPMADQAQSVPAIQTIHSEEPVVQSIKPGMPDSQPIQSIKDDESINAPAYTKSTYTVKKGDTLYSIAFLAGMDYEDLAKLNHIAAPYILSIGQVLKLIPEKQRLKAASFKTVFWSPKKKAAEKAETGTLKTSKPAFRWRPQKEESLPDHATWQWPIKGKVISGFSLAPGGNRGIDIASYYGAAVKASAAGQVVYSGNGIRGYGNIIIVKNTRHFLSAYAYNATNLVRDGQWVKQGQTIATMGRNLAGEVMLHFEVRFYGKAVDPMRYLPK